MKIETRTLINNIVFNLGCACIVYMIMTMASGAEQKNPKNTKILSKAPKFGWKNSAVDGKTVDMKCIQTKPNCENTCIETTLPLLLSFSCCYVSFSFSPFFLFLAPIGNFMGMYLWTKEVKRSGFYSQCLLLLHVYFYTYSATFINGMAWHGISISKAFTVYWFYGSHIENAINEDMCCV